MFAIFGKVIATTAVLKNVAMMCSHELEGKERPSSLELVQ